MKQQSIAAQTAKAIRTELKKAFPQIKFSVSCENYSGGNSVRIRYTDAVLVEAVESVVKKYQQGSFNSQEDIYEYDNNIDGLPQVKYVFVTRDMSETAKEAIVKQINDTYVGCAGLAYDDRVQVGCFAGDMMWALVRRIFVKIDYTVPAPEPTPVTPPAPAVKVFTAAQLQTKLDGLKMAKNSIAYKFVKQVINGATSLRPCWTQGSGRYIKNNDHTAATVGLLNLLGIEHRLTNDSTRGGLTGNLITIFSKINK